MGRRPTPHIVRRALALGTLLWAMAPAASPADCLKDVFGRYCLGGDIEQQIRSMPAPLARESKGNSLALIFPDGADRLYLLAYTGQIYKVVRAYAVSTQLRFDDIDSDLRQIYGERQDQSRFPAYATSPALRLAAIRRGEGRLLHRWTPSPEWHIELSWTRELGVSLAYIATALDARRTAQVEGGF